MNQEKEGLKIGADPELFLYNARTKSYVSSHDIIKGDKKKPFLFYINKTSTIPVGATQVDGVTAEFNIAPESEADLFQDNIICLCKELLRQAKEKNEHLTLSAIPTAKFEKDYFEKLPKETKLMGCMPDNNVYTGKENPAPIIKRPMRFGGGHIHLGWTDCEDVEDEAHMFDCQEVVKQLDHSLFLYSFIWDKNQARRTTYGKVGSFRYKPYGVEYRSLSNVWVCDPDLHRFVFDCASYAYNLLEDDMKLEDDKKLSQIVSAINKKPSKTLDKKTIKKIVDYLEEEYEFPEIPSGYLN